MREQLTEMFSASGFDARRDIAGIVLNRWGHAYCSPQPGFFFGRDGQDNRQAVNSCAAHPLAALHSPILIFPETPGMQLLSKKDSAQPLNYWTASRKSGTIEGQK